MSVQVSGAPQSAVVDRFAALEAEVETFSGAIDDLGRKTGALRRSLDDLSATLARVPRRTLWRRWRRG